MKKVMILGAGLLQTFVIKRAKELGYQTLVLDMDKNALGFKYADQYSTINIVDKEACLNFAKEHKIDGVLTAATDYGVLTAAYIAKEMNLPGLNPEVVKIIKNKYLVRKTLHESNADDTPQFFEISNINDLDAIEKELIYPLMVKPCDGSGSKGVCKVNNKKELLNAIEDALRFSLSKKTLIETFIEGKEYGVESFVYNGEVHILGIMKKEMTKPPYYAELGHSLPSDLPETMKERVEQVVKKSINALKINFGAVNMDLLITKNQEVCVVDIGTRMGGNLIGSHIIPLSTGIDHMGNIIKTAVGENPDFIKKSDRNVATHLLNLNPGKVKKIPDFDKYEDNDVEVICKLNVGDTINEYRNNLDGCGYVVVQGNDVKQCMYKAEEIKEIIDKDIIRENV